MRQYLNAVQNVLEKGTRKENRTGVDTISTFGEYYEIDLAQGFPLLTTKEISWKNIVIENLWFLSGSKSIKALQRHGCKFWNAWADKDGYVPSAYGNFWRRFEHVEDNVGAHGRCYAAGRTDQVSWVLNELKKNPLSRRLVVSAWQPSNALYSKLPPCHAFWVLNVQNTPTHPATLAEEIDREILRDLLSASGVIYEPPVEQRLCLHLTQRSCDMALGVPYNIAGYAFILSLFSHLTGIKPGIFAHTLVDAHVYTKKPDGSMAEYDHIPGLRDQMKRECRWLPTLKISDDVKSLDPLDIEKLLELPTEEILEKFKLTGYDPWPKIDFKVAV